MKGKGYWQNSNNFACLYICVYMRTRFMAFFPDESITETSFSFSMQKTDVQAAQTYCVAILTNNN